MVEKLVSSPLRNGSASYICGECVEVCHDIFEGQKREREPENQPLEAAERFVGHPLAVEFLGAGERWAVRDLTGLVALEELNELRTLAARMLHE